MNYPISPEELAIPRSVTKARRLDRGLRRVSYTAWGATLLVIAILAAYEITNISMMQRVISGESGPGLNDLWLRLRIWSPAVRTIGAFTLAVAISTTLAVFLRLRTASLAEIQERLASIEEALIAGGK